jgi:hypothetical protein
VGRFRECFTSLSLLNETPLQAARELYYIHAQIQAETKLYSRKRDNYGDVEPQGMVSNEPAGNAGDQQNGHGGVELRNLGNSEPVGSDQRAGQGGIGLQGVGNNNPASGAEIQRTGRWRRFWQGLPAYWMRFWQLFSIPRIRHATVAAFVVMISQQLCGVNVIGEIPVTRAARKGVYLTVPRYSVLLRVDIRPLWRTRTCKYRRDKTRTA